ncbi:Peroxidase 15 [Morella rubra]|uniref:peroxidase n=1 Tax=Morella rubra TaxID=262757 RepID=A0A6A1UST7_9ROSI|nr:Peroxidase 15 [Morella rubra]
MPSFIVAKAILCACLLFATSSIAQKSGTVYESRCLNQNFSNIVSGVVEQATQNHVQIGAKLVLLHFHDCFVQVSLLRLPRLFLLDYQTERVSEIPDGRFDKKKEEEEEEETHKHFEPIAVWLPEPAGCDSSILLDNADGIESEKDAAPNSGSAGGYVHVDDIKSALENVCPGVVSCADISANSSQILVSLAGGSTWEVQLGSRDSRIANRNGANSTLPNPFGSLSDIKAKFFAAGLDSTDLVALSDQLVPQDNDTCHPFFAGDANAVTQDCWMGLGQVLQKSMKSLCVLMKDGDDPNLALKINATLALHLATAYDAANKVSECVNSALLHLAPNGTEAKAFEDLSNSIKRTRAPAVSGNSTGNGSSSAAVEKSDGGRVRKRWLGAEIVSGILLWLFWFPLYPNYYA